jgi:glycosyltransferase involved in cell wall biosynthesis
VAEGLVRRGHDVHVICSRRSYTCGDRRYPSKEEINGIHIHRLAATGFGRGRSLGRLSDYASFYLLALWHELTIAKVDVCIALTTPPFSGLLGVVLGWIRKSRLVIWTMDLYPEVLIAYGALKKDSLRYKLLAGLSRWLYRRSWRIISLGEVMSQKLIAAGAGPDKIVAVDNWVPGEVIEPMASSSSRVWNQWRRGSEVTIMYSGNLGLGHDLDTLLQAVDITRRQLPVRVMFVGGGPMVGPLEKLTKQLRLDSIDFYPGQPLEMLSDSMAAGDIHLVSQREGTQGVIVPSKLYGVLAAGRAVIFVGPGDCEAAAIVRNSQAGIVIPPGDITAMVKTLTLLVRDEKLRNTMGRRGRSYYENFFGQHRSVNAIITTIEGGMPARTTPRFRIDTPSTLPATATKPPTPSEKTYP